MHLNALFVFPFYTPLLLCLLVVGILTGETMDLQTLGHSLSSEENYWDLIMVQMVLMFMSLCGNFVTAEYLQKNWQWNQDYFYQHHCCYFLYLKITNYYWYLFSILRLNCCKQSLTSVLWPKYCSQVIIKQLAANFDQLIPFWFFAKGINIRKEFMISLQKLM